MRDDDDGTRDVERLPKFANFEPSPDDSKPDGTKALAGKITRKVQCVRCICISPYQSREDIIFDFTSRTLKTQKIKTYRSSQSQDTTTSAKRQKKYFGPYSPSASRDSKKSKSAPSSIESPLPKFTNFVGPYAESAYIR